MIIIIIVMALVGLMFWQPQMSSDYSYTPPIKPTKKERYISNINRLIKEEHYEIVADLLSRTKYSKKELPLEYWRQEIDSKLLRVLEESKQIDNLRNLERILNS